MASGRRAGRLLNNIRVEGSGGSGDNNSVAMRPAPTKANIYESIHQSPVSTMNHSNKLDEPDESHRLLMVDQNHWDFATTSTYDQDQNSSHQIRASTGRRYPNENANEDEDNDDENDVHLNREEGIVEDIENKNPYSEIRKQNKDSSSIDSSSGNYRLVPLEGEKSYQRESEENKSANFNDSIEDYYKIPTRATRSQLEPQAVVGAGHSTSSLLNEERNQLIETKRKRTLMLLKAKEAPMASIEITSPIEEVAVIVDIEPQVAQQAEQLSPASGVSDYENLNLSSKIDPPVATGSSEVVELEAAAAENINQEQQQQQEAPSDPIGDASGVISPSESQNFNTLSITSDILGDLSQEENSLVQQLGLPEI